MAEHVYPFGTPCRFADQCSEDRCVCGDIGHFCPIECATCATGGEGDRNA